ncbi:MAG: hypothetical protein COB22_05190 [Cycloclasticus sp.]|nr:MAG: hypothetical protein COB22_05190 [Cycloclasticus sp.]
MLVIYECLHDNVDTFKEIIHMPPLIKYLIVFILFVIIYNLFKAFYHLSKQTSNPKQVVKSLVIRVGLSIALFVSILLATHFGLIKSHGLIPPNPAQLEQPAK